MTSNDFELLKNRYQAAMENLNCSELRILKTEFQQFIDRGECVAEARDYLNMVDSALEKLCGAY